MWSVWTTVLEENEKLARARLAAVEVFQQQIADEAKVLRAYKLAISKRCVESLGNVQRDVQISVQEVDKNKKSYFDEEHCAHDVRDKARDIEEKLKKKKAKKMKFDFKKKFCVKANFKRKASTALKGQVICMKCEF